MKIENTQRAIELIAQKEEYECLIASIKAHKEHKTAFYFTLNSRMVYLGTTSKGKLKEFQIKDDDFKIDLQELVLNHYSNELEKIIKEIELL